MAMIKKIFTAHLLMFALVLGGCAQRKVDRIDPNSQTDLSGRWNDTDARLVAEEMTNDAINRPWRTNFIAKNDRPPVIIIGLVNNKTDEHIDSEVFIKNMEREFINSNMISIVQGGEFREQLREERADQQKYSSPETAKSWGREKGADYILNGNISKISDQAGKERTFFYQVNLELTDLETNEKVWIGEKKIKKAIVN
ncbi:MAG: penicillin-binding protein activator LpoB [Bacteroidia bacterium]